MVLLCSSLTYVTLFLLVHIANALLIAFFFMGCKMCSLSFVHELLCYMFVKSRELVALMSQVSRMWEKLLKASSMKVTTTDLPSYMQTMVDLLQDPITLRQDPASKRTVTEIRRVIRDN